MEGGTHTEDGTTMKLWFADLTFSWEGENLDEADTKAREVIDFARQQGFNLCEGHTSRAREREPVETMYYGSDEPLRNFKARSEYEDVAGRIASGAGARSHA